MRYLVQHGSNEYKTVEYYTDKSTALADFVALKQAAGPHQVTMRTLFAGLVLKTVQ